MSLFPNEDLHDFSRGNLRWDLLYLYTNDATVPLHFENTEGCHDHAKGGSGQLLVKFTSI